MDFSRSSEQDAFFTATRDLAAKVIAPGAAERDRDGYFDREVWNEMARGGIVGMPIPETYGGSGGSIVDCCLANEALRQASRRSRARLCGSISRILRPAFTAGRFGRTLTEGMQRASLPVRPNGPRGIVWSGSPVPQRAPLQERLAALACVLVSLVALGFSVVVSVGLGQSPAMLVTLSALAASAGLFVWRLPPLWRAMLRYEITEEQVVWKRGPFRRLMDRQSLSYARIQWHPTTSGVGDLILVRAVPIGVLWRTLSLRLSNLPAPDRVLALLRGVEPGPSMGRGSVPLAQRLDEGELVLWSARPLATRWDRRRLWTMGLAMLLVFSVVRAAVHLARPLVQIHHALTGGVFWVFVASIALGWAMVLATGLALGYVAFLRPSRWLRDTRYFVTNRRVLIRRGSEELSLDRTRIAYVIAGNRRGSRDLFLVLDGPRARAMAIHGAFGGVDEPTELSPVLAAIPPGDGPESLLSPAA